MNSKVRLAEDRIPGRIAFGALLFVAVMTLALIAWAAFLRGQHLEPPPAPLMQVGATVSEVRQTLILQERPGLERKARQLAHLERFGWVDRTAGVAHLPIEVAMEQVAQEPANE